MSRRCLLLTEIHCANTCNGVYSARALLPGTVFLAVRARLISILSTSTNVDVYFRKDPASHVDLCGEYLYEPNGRTSF